MAATDREDPVPCTKCVFPLERHVMPEYEPGDTPMINAAFEGHQKCLKAWIDAGADVNKGNYRHETALHHAAKMGQPKCAEILLEAGAGVNIVNTHGNSAAILVCSGVFFECLGILLKAGADVNIVNKEGDTALMTSVRSGEEQSDECAQALIEKGADVNFIGRSGQTPLMLAVDSYTDTTVRALIEAGANVNASDDSGFTPLMNAAYADSVGTIIPLLEAGADVNAARPNGMTALRLTAVAQCTAYLLNAGAHVNTSDYLGYKGLTLRNVQYKKDLSLLLYAAGQKMPPKMDEVLGIDKCKLQLLHLSREAIRNHFIKLDPYNHLFNRIPKLGLPDSLTKYLLYYVSLEEKMESFSLE